MLCLLMYRLDSFGSSVVPFGIYLLVGVLFMYHESADDDGPNYMILKTIQIISTCSHPVPQPAGARLLLKSRSTMAVSYNQRRNARPLRVERPVAHRIRTAGIALARTDGTNEKDGEQTATLARKRRGCCLLHAGQARPSGDDWGPFLSAPLVLPSARALLLIKQVVAIHHLAASLVPPKN